MTSSISLFVTFLSRQKKCAKVEHKLQTTGKGMNLFQKRQQHVQKYIVDQPNENYDKDANHSHLQNGNALNGVNGVNETNGNHSPSPMFSVNLKHVAGKSSEAAGNGHQNGEASFNIQARAKRTTKVTTSLNMCDFGFEPWTSPIKGYYHLLTLSKAASDWPTRVTDERKTKEKV